MPLNHQNHCSKCLHILANEYYCLFPRDYKASNINIPYLGYYLFQDVISLIIQNLFNIKESHYFLREDELIINLMDRISYYFGFAQEFEL